jgi:Disulphide bond corrector protein DsbC
MALLKSLFLFLFSGISVTYLVAQSPVNWSYRVEPISKEEVMLVFLADIQDGWNTYSQFLTSDEGPVATSFTFTPSSTYQLVGKAEETGDVVKTYDEVFAMELTKIKHKGVFSQRVRITDKLKPITGTLEFMVCNGEMCLPPKTIEFSFTPAEADGQ